VDVITASASVRTSSTMSSLSQNTMMALPGVPCTRTRSSLTINSDSNDGDDLDEDDNMYDDPNTFDI
jgi:hypothetical protein